VAKNERAGFFHYSYTEFEEFTVFEMALLFSYITAVDWTYQMQGVPVSLPIKNLSTIK
jgi:hypothetical protein